MHNHLMSQIILLGCNFRSVLITLQSSDYNPIGVKLPYSFTYGKIDPIPYLKRRVCSVFRDLVDLATVCYSL